MRLLANVTCVSLTGRGLLIAGAPGSGKSTLALALIDRGAILVGDDGVALSHSEGHLWAHPGPEIAGKLEIRGVGILELATVSAPVCLAVTLGDESDRLPLPGTMSVAGIAVPHLPVLIGAAHIELRIEHAMTMHGAPPPPTLV